MKPAIPKIIRVVGIVVTAVAIPLSILVLLTLQGTGNDYQVVMLLYIGWALIDFIAIPFMLLGFIIRYTVRSIIYLAVVHLALSLAITALLFTGTVIENVALLVITAVIALSSLLYLIGAVTYKQNNRSQQDDPTNSLQQDNTTTV